MKWNISVVINKEIKQDCGSNGEWIRDESYLNLFWNLNGLKSNKI